MLKNVVYPGAVPNHQLSNFIRGSSRRSQEEGSSSRLELQSIRARWPGVEDPDREEVGEWIADDSRAWPFRMGPRWCTRSKTSGCERRALDVVGDSWSRSIANSKPWPDAHKLADLRPGLGDRDRRDWSPNKRSQATRRFPIFRPRYRHQYKAFIDTLPRVRGRDPKPSPPCARNPPTSRSTCVSMRPEKAATHAGPADPRRREGRNSMPVTGT